MFWDKKVTSYRIILGSSLTNVISLNVFFISSYVLWNALRAGKKKKSFLNRDKLSFSGSCGLEDSLQFISKMTTAAKVAVATSAINYCLVRCLFFFSELQLCSSSEYNSLAQLPRWLVVPEEYIWPRYFLWDIQQPWVLTSFLLSPPWLGERDVYSVICWMA